MRGRVSAKGMSKYIYLKYKYIFQVHVPYFSTFTWVEYKNICYFYQSTILSLYLYFFHYWFHQDDSCRKSFILSFYFIGNIFSVMCGVDSKFQPHLVNGHEICSPIGENANCRGGQKKKKENVPVTRSYAVWTPPHHHSHLFHSLRSSRSLSITFHWSLSQFAAQNLTKTV